MAHKLVEPALSHRDDAGFFCAIKHVLLVQYSLLDQPNKSVFVWRHALPVIG